MNGMPLMLKRCVLHLENWDAIASSLVSAFTRKHVRIICRVETVRVNILLMHACTCTKNDALEMLYVHSSYVGTFNRTNYIYAPHNASLMNGVVTPFHWIKKKESEISRGCRNNYCVCTSVNRNAKYQLHVRNCSLQNSNHKICERLSSLTVLHTHAVN